MNKIQGLLQEKIRILQTLLDCMKKYRDLLDPKNATSVQATPEQKLDWVDALTSERESQMRTLQLLDRQIAEEGSLLQLKAVENLQGQEWIRNSLEQIIQLGNEIQLTDQSLFLYINNIGFEIRSKILKSLKEKEALSKFKSQNSPSTGEGLDQKA